MSRLYCDGGLSISSDVHLGVLQDAGTGGALRSAHDRRQSLWEPARLRQCVFQDPPRQTLGFCVVTRSVSLDPLSLSLPVFADVGSGGISGAGPSSMSSMIGLPSDRALAEDEECLRFSLTLPWVINIWSIIKAPSMLLQVDQHLRS